MNKQEIVNTLARQYKKIDLALTDEGWDRQVLKLYGMQQAYMTVLDMATYRELNARAEKIARG